MKNSFFTRLAAVGALCCAFSAFASNVQAQTLHLVTVESAKSDERNARYVAGHVDQFFRENVPAERLNLVRLEKEKATPDAVVAEIRKLLVGSDDVVVFYFYGLAGDDRDAAGQTFRFFEKENENERRLSRQKVRAELANLRPRLLVLLSDCDNVGAPMTWPKGALPPAREVSLVAQKLFFEPSGCVDITLSKPGQYSFGAIATRAWISVFHEVDRILTRRPVRGRRLENRFGGDDRKNGRNVQKEVSQRNHGARRLPRRANPARLRTPGRAAFGRSSSNAPPKLRRY